jgi:FMN phosphatase YigB (HAD superfamily)
VAPEEALMVGDNYAHDVEGARAAGLHAVWLRRSGRLDATPGAGGRPATQEVPVISSLRELPGLLG